MTLDEIELNFWARMKNGLTVFTYLEGEDYLSRPYRACSEGERSPLWLLAPLEAALLRRLHRNDNGVAVVAADEPGIFARLSGKLRKIDDSFSLQRLSRSGVLPWPQLLAGSALLRFDVAQAAFWESGGGPVMHARLDVQRQPTGAAAAVVRMVGNVQRQIQPAR